MPEIQPLNAINPDIIGEMIHLFIVDRNYKLKTKLLSIILRFFNQRKEMIKSLHKIKIMTAESDPELFLWSKINISIFRNLAEQSEIICKYWLQTSLLHEKTLEKLETLTSLMISFEEIMHKDCKLVDGNLVNEKGKIDPDRQLMLRNLEFHTHVICLVKDGMHILEGIYDDPKNLKEREAKERLLRLFKLCFKTLTIFVAKNPKNQKTLHGHLDIICSNLKMQVDQIELLCEIFRDNAELCTTVTEAFLQQFIELILHEGRQSIFLSFFEVIVEVNGIGNPNIQRIVLMLMCQPEVFLHVFYMGSNEKFLFEANKENFSEQYIDQPFVYHAKLINVLTKCGTSSSAFQLTKAKCQKIISLSEIFNLIVKDKEFKALELPLLNFLLKIYISSDINKEELENNKDFLKVIEKKCAELQSITSVNQINIKTLEK